MSPTPLALHPYLKLYVFRVLSNSDRAVVFFFFLHLSRPGGCKVSAGSGSKFLVLIEIEPCLEAFKPRTSWPCPDLTGARFGFVFGSKPLAFFRWSLGWMPPILKKWTCLDHAGESLGWLWLETFLSSR